MHISFSTFTQWAPRLVLVSVGLIAVNLIWFYPAIRGARTSASILALEINDRFRKGVESYLATALNEVVRRADEIVLEPDRQERAFNRILKNNSGFRDIALVDLDGKETARIDRFQLVRKEDFKEHSRASYFRQALAGRENFGDVFITPEGEPHIVLAVPMRGLEKITLNMGVGEAVADKKVMEFAVGDMQKIAGQKPVVTMSKKSIAGFKIREGYPVGCKVTLRKARMYEFLDRLVSVAIPRIRDFRGISGKSFDGRGNYNMGVKEQIIFPEIEYEKIDALRGMNITITTSAKTDEEAKALLLAFKLPLKK